MDNLVSFFLAVRRRTRRWLPLVVVLAFAGLVGLHARAKMPESTFAGVLTGMLLWLMWRAHRRTQKHDQSVSVDIELGLLMAVIAYATVIHVDGSLSGPFYPMVFVAVAVVSAMTRPRVALGVIAASIVYEAALAHFTLDGIETRELLPHLGFLMVLFTINALSLRMEVSRLRQASVSQLEEERETIRRKARSYRLLRSPSVDESAATEGDEDRRLHSGVEQIQLSLLFGLKLVHECLSLHTAMLLWLSDDGQQLEICELVSEDETLVDGPFSARDGIFGAVIAQQKPLRVDNLRASYLLPYYSDDCPVRAALALPVFQHGQLTGLLVVDRKSETSFTLEEEDLARRAAQFSARTVENERVFHQLERTKDEQAQLYRATERLAAAVTEEEVVEAGLQSVSEIANVTFCAITEHDETKGTHRICATKGTGDDLDGSEFADNAALVAMAVRNRHPLPYRGEFDANRQVVFDRRLPVANMPSLLVLPLVVHEKARGTLVVGSDQPSAFRGPAARRILEVLANQLAVSFANAAMVRKLEEQATTDGLTGLLNKRAMYDTARAKLTAATRFSRQLSIMIADIDHFKRVNDTYGHHVGDVVIRGLAEIHRRNMRETDAVARFGGEEFVTICEETDAEGARLLAERIRQEFGDTTYHVDGHAVQCTCSIGIATFPSAGEDWDTLFKHSDAALYVSKKGGRNLVTSYDAKTHGGIEAA